VAHEYPAAAPVAAVTATTIQHKQIGLIAKAAAAAAPSEAARIVAALIKEFPQDYGTIATAAADGAPNAGQEILNVVADYVPALQPTIHSAATNFAANNGSVPVQAILTQSYTHALNSGAAVSTQIPPALSSPSPNQTVIPGAAMPAAGQTTPSLASSPRATAPMPTYAPPLLMGPVLGNPFVPILGPGFGGTPPVTIGINYATPVPYGPGNPRTPVGNNY
jgi:hypothetical protein